MSVLIMLVALLCGPVSPCAEEDGSTQPACVWSDGTGAVVLNLDYGRSWAVLDGRWTS
jgi:hypothetical protein